MLLISSLKMWTLAAEMTTVTRFYQLLLLPQYMMKLSGRPVSSCVVSKSLVTNTKSPANGLDNALDGFVISHEKFKGVFPNKESL